MFMFGEDYIIFVNESFVIGYLLVDGNVFWSYFCEGLSNGMFNIF